MVNEMLVVCAKQLQKSAVYYLLVTFSSTERLMVRLLFNRQVKLTPLSSGVTAGRHIVLEFRLFAGFISTCKPPRYQIKVSAAMLLTTLQLIVFESLMLRSKRVSLALPFNSSSSAV